MGTWNDQERGHEAVRAETPSRRVAGCMAALVGAIGLGGLVGWEAGVPWLMHWASWSGWEAPGGALAMLACAASLWLQLPVNVPRWRRRLAQGVSAATGIVALTAALEHASGIDLVFDDVLFTIGLPAPPDGAAGNSGFGATMTLLCASMSLVLLRTRSLPALCVSTASTSGALVLSLTALFGYSLDVSRDSGFWKLFGMALQSAVGFLVLGGGIMAGRPDRPLVATIISPHAGGIMARRILPFALGLPILLAVIQLMGEQAEGGSRSASMALRISLFVSLQTIVVLVSAYALNRTDARRRAAEESRRRMLDELDHRVKNTLASVISVCEQTLDSSRSLEEFRRAFMGRVHAMARAHEALAAHRWDGVSVRTLVETTMAPFVNEGNPRVRIDGRETLLPAAATLPVAATLHELATNAAKHGALSGPGGGIDVKWSSPSGGGTSIRWTETPGKAGGGRSRPVHSGGFGTTLIRGLVAHELKGSTDLVIDETGVRCSIFVPQTVRGLEAEGGVA